MRYLLVVLSFTFAHSVLAQSVGPIGPGPGSVEGTTMVGEFAQWNRNATPTLVFRPAGPGLKVFSDIDTSGKFTLNLPELTSDTAFATKGCGDPGKGPVSILNTVDLLTTLEGLGSASDANQGLSVIGMAIFADEAYANDIGIQGGKRLEWFSSPVERTLDVGECNNLNPIKLNTGWTAVTQISGGSGGPHAYEQGVDPELSWYWWAFKEPVESNAETLPGPAGSAKAAVIPAQENLLTGTWNALEFEGQMDLTFNASGTALFETSEGSGEVIAGSWMINDANAELNLEGVGDLSIELRDDESLSVVDASNSIAIEFVRAGTAHQPPSMTGVFEGSTGQGMVLTLGANGQATVDFGFEDRPSIKGNWFLQDYQLVIESPATDETLRYNILSMAAIGFNLSGENLGNDVVFFFKQ